MFLFALFTIQENKKLLKGLFSYFGVVMENKHAFPCLFGILGAFLYYNS
jgi:hypothetical protein